MLVRKKTHNKVKNNLSKKTEDYALLKQRVRSLLWNLSNQREKVSGNILTLLEMLYPGYDQDQLFEIKNEIMKNIK